MFILDKKQNSSYFLVLRDRTTKQEAFYSCICKNYVHKFYYTSDKVSDLLFEEYKKMDVNI